jgi:hypothetical protein
MSDHLLAALVDHVRVCHAAAMELGTPVFAAELHLPLGPGGEVTAGKKGQQMTLVPFVSQHPKTITRQYVEQTYHPGGVAKVVGQVWESVVSWATEYTMALPEATPVAAAPAAPEGLYLPEDTAELARCIKQAMRPELLETYRQHLLSLRDRRKIDASEQMRLAAQCEERLDEITALM